MGRDDPRWGARALVALAGAATCTWAVPVLARGPTGIVRSLSLVNQELEPATLTIPAQHRLWMLVAGALVLGATLLAVAASAGVYRRVAQGGASLAREFSSLGVSAAEGWRALGAAERLALTAIGLAGAVARIGLAFLPVSYDEAISYVWFASRGLFDAVSDYTIANNHVAQTAGMWLTSSLFGADAFTIRLTALLHGLLVLPLSFVAGTRLANARVGAISAMLAAVLPPLLEYSAQGRGYAMASAWLLVGLAALSREEACRSRPSLAVAAIAFSLAAWSTPAAAFGVVVVGLWFLADAWPSGWRRALARLVALAAVTATMTLVLFAPVMARSGASALFDNRTVQTLSLSVWLRALPLRLDRILECWVGLLPAGVQLTCLGLVVSLLVLGRDLARLRALLLSFVVGVFGLLLLQRVAPESRVLSYLAVFAALLLGAGLVAVAQRLHPRLATHVVSIGALATAVWLGLWTNRVLGLTPQARAIVQNDPGADARFCCREGTYALAESLADQADSIADALRPIVTKRYSGELAPVRFYLRAKGRPIRLLIYYYPTEPVLQLAPYREFLVLTGQGDPSRAVSGVLGIPADSVDRLFTLVPHPSTIGTQRMVRAAWRQPPPAEAIANLRLPNTVAFPF